MVAITRFARDMRMVEVVAVVAVLLAAAFALSCSTNRDPDSLFAPESGTLVVDAVLQVGERPGVIRLTETQAANDVYDPAAAAVTGAMVWILGPRDTLFCTEVEPGSYQPLGFAYDVVPGEQYELQVATPDGRELSASTLTPQPLVIDNWVLLDDTGTRVTRTLVKDDPGAPENQVVYTRGLIEARLQPFDEPAYVVGLISETPGSPLVIETDLIEEEDLNRSSSSPPLESSDGRLRLPWFAIWWEGVYTIRIHRMDRNWYDYARSAPVPGGNFGFGGSAGDNFERPIFHVDGGIGLFGSMAADEIRITILPRP